MGDGPPSANPDTAIDFAPGAPEGKGEEPSRRQRVGPWAPVIPLKVGPHVAGGDSARVSRHRPHRLRVRAVFARAAELRPPSSASATSGTVALAVQNDR